MNVLSKAELIEAHELTDVNINKLQLKKSQLIKIMNDCNNEDSIIHISKILKDVMSLEELTTQVLHSLVGENYLYSRRRNSYTLLLRESFTSSLTRELATVSCLLLK